MRRKTQPDPQVGHPEFRIGEQGALDDLLAFEDTLAPSLIVA